MTIGFIMLAHQDLHRTEQVARYWAERGSPVVIHVDVRCPNEEYENLKVALGSLTNIRFSDRIACDWGKYALVAASLDCVRILLDDFPEISHCFLASGSCLPIRPLSDLQAYLEARPETDFIESFTTDEVTWTVGGLDLERFTLRFPFSWKKQRKLFDGYVNLQRRIGYSRTIPEGIRPHMGSQWWCLTSNTLRRILDDQRREEIDKYFKKVWIPDEAYFQTLVRNHAIKVESRSLTLSRFDDQGKPHIFYDDHLQLLTRTNCFVARKIWPEADLLYKHFLDDSKRMPSSAEPNPANLDKVLSKLKERRAKGRTGLVMQSAFPIGQNWGTQKTCDRYTVYQGFSDLFSKFAPWLEKRTGAQIHGHLFNPEKVEFSGGVEVYNGCLSDSAKLRDYDPEAFLRNLMWNSQGERQGFQMGPYDHLNFMDFLSWDSNAKLFIITGAWAVPLFHSELDFQTRRSVAAKYQATEVWQLERLRWAGCGPSRA